MAGAVVGEDPFIGDALVGEPLVGPLPECCGGWALFKS